MPPLANERHERFASALASGMTPTMAYLAVVRLRRNRTPHNTPALATRLSNRADIQDRIVEISAERALIETKSVEIAIDERAISRGWVLSSLVEIVERCMGKVGDDKQFRPQYAIEALRLLGLNLGMFGPPRTPPKPEDDLEALSREELERVVRGETIEEVRSSSQHAIVADTDSAESGPP